MGVAMREIPAREDRRQDPDRSDHRRGGGNGKRQLAEEQPARGDRQGTLEVVRARLVLRSEQGGPASHGVEGRQDHRHLEKPVGPRRPGRRHANHHPLQKHRQHEHGNPEGPL